MDIASRCAFCVIAFLSGVLSFEIITPPRNASVGTGQDIVLTCEVRDNNPGEFIEWREFINSRQSGVRIWLSPDISNIVHPNNTKYAVTGMFDLTVRDVTVYDGGMYSCGLVVADIRYGAQVSIIEQPACAVQTQDIVEGEEVNMTCFAEFGGNKKPDVYFEDENNNRPDFIQNDEIYSREILSTFNATWQDDNREFTCYSKVYTPDFSANCSLTLDVKYPVRNITFEPKENIYFVGEEVNCSTSGNPVPEITWEQVSPPSDGLVSDHTLPITSAMMSQPQEWKCTARNRIRSMNFVTVAYHSFSVMPGVTQPPTDGSAKLSINLFATLTLLLLRGLTR